MGARDLAKTRLQWLTAMQSLDITIRVEARSRSLVRLPERGGFADGHTVSPFTQRSRIGHPHDPCVHDARRQISGQFGGTDLDDGSRGVAVKDWEQVGLMLQLRIRRVVLIADRWSDLGETLDFWERRIQRQGWSCDGPRELRRTGDRQVL